ncbi:uncharacterized protein LOC142336509 isoform X2 [Convolutriloba macropyga]|uniref:uncharacterized protein LOC142336509 isoform X2 n=1 Tax=Convolutriloba macropyga TaxID=536237 RepID=UPI003F51EA81
MAEADESYVHISDDDGNLSEVKESTASKTETTEDDKPKIDEAAEPIVQTSVVQESPATEPEKLDENSQNEDQLTVDDSESAKNAVAESTEGSQRLEGSTANEKSPEDQFSGTANVVRFIQSFFRRPDVGRARSQSQQSVESEPQVSSVDGKLESSIAEEDDTSEPKEGAVSEDVKGSEDVKEEQSSQQPTEEETPRAIREPINDFEENPETDVMVGKVDEIEQPVEETENKSLEEQKQKTIDDVVPPDAPLSEQKGDNEVPEMVIDTVVALPVNDEESEKTTEVEVSQLHDEKSPTEDQNEENEQSAVLEETPESSEEAGKDTVEPKADVDELTEVDGAIEETNLDEKSESEAPEMTEQTLLPMEVVVDDDLLKESSDPEKESAGQLVEIEVEQPDEASETEGPELEQIVETEEEHLDQILETETQKIVEQDPEPSPLESTGDEQLDQIDDSNEEKVDQISFEINNMELPEMVEATKVVDEKDETDLAPEKESFPDESESNETTEKNEEGVDEKITDAPIEDNQADVNEELDHALETEVSQPEQNDKTPDEIETSEPTEPNPVSVEITAGATESDEMLESGAESEKESIGMFETVKELLIPTIEIDHVELEENIEAQEETTESEEQDITPVEIRDDKVDEIADEKVEGADIDEQESAQVVETDNEPVVLLNENVNRELEVADDKTEEPDQVAKTEQEVDETVGAQLVEMVEAEEEVDLNSGVALEEFNDNETEKADEETELVIEVSSPTIEIEKPEAVEDFYQKVESEDELENPPALEVNVNIESKPLEFVQPYSEENNDEQFEKAEAEKDQNTDRERHESEIEQYHPDEDIVVDKDESKEDEAKQSDESAAESTNGKTDQNSGGKIMKFIATFFKGASSTESENKSDENTQEEPTSADSPAVETVVEPVQNGAHILENGSEPCEPETSSPPKEIEAPHDETSNENQEPTEAVTVEDDQEKESVEPEVASDEHLTKDTETAEEQPEDTEKAQSDEIVETEKEQLDQNKETETPATTIVEVVQTTINGTETEGDADAENTPATVQVTTTTTFTTKVTVTSESTEEEPSVEGGTDGHPGGPQGGSGEPGDELLDEGPEVSLSREEEQLLEKLKYQPFAVAQDIQNLTPQQREKINLYQRRESLARVNSLKRQSPSVSISLSTKRASESSQGRRGSDFTPLNSTNIDNSASRTLNEEKPVAEKPDEEKENEQPPATASEDTEEKVVDTTTGVYQQMKLFTPKPYSHSIDSTQPNSGATSPRNAITIEDFPSIKAPNMSQARKTNPDQRYSTLPLTTDYSKMQSAGDLSPSSPNKATTPTGESRRVDRSQSVKETQEEIDRMRKHVYEMKLKFLGEPVPAVYPYPLQTDDDPLNDEVVEDDVIDAPKNAKQVESSNPSALQKPSKSKKHAASDKDGKKASPKKPASNPFYKLLCGSGKSKDYADEEQY